MKNLFKTMMLVAAAAMGFTACTNDTTEEFATPAGSGTTKTITATTDITRTQFGADRGHLAWSKGDEFGVFTDVAADNDKNIGSGAYDPDGDGTYTLTVDAAATMVYAYYPKNTGSASAQTVHIDIPKEQTQGAAGEFHGKDMPMTAKGEITGSTVNLQFSPVACALALNICNGQEGETIKKVTFTTAADTEKCSGYDSKGNDITADQLNYNGYNNNVILTVPDIPANGTVPAATEEKQKFANQIYLVVARKAYSAGATFVVETSKENYTFTTKKELNCSNSDFMPITLDLTKGTTPPEGTWEQVTALSDITEGTYVIVNDNHYLPSTTTSKSPVKTNDQQITIKNNCLVGTIKEEMKWYFTGTSSEMSIKNAEGNFLTVSGNDNTNIRVNTSPDTWAFETNKTGFAAKDKNHNRFVATYKKDWRSYSSKNASNYKDSGILYLYKFKEASVPQPTTPYIAVSPIEAPAAGEEAGISTTAYEVRNSASAAEVTATDGTVVTEAFVDTDGLYYVVSPNYTGTARKGSITLALTDDPSVTAAIEVNQEADVFTVETETVTLGNAAGAEVSITVTSSYPWTIDDSALAGFTVSPATYDEMNSTGVKHVTVTAAAANETAETVDLGSFVITRTTGDADTNKTKTVAVKQNGASTATSIIFDYTSVTTTQQGGATDYTKTISSIHLVGNKGSNSNAPRENSAGQLRVYTNNTLTFSGATITKVVITATTSYHGTWKEGNASLTTSNNGITTWEGNTTSLTLTQTNKTQARIKTIEVFYE